MHPRFHYQVDKSRSLLLTCAMIRLRQIAFFDNDYKDQQDKGLLRDFLALVEEKISTNRVGEIYRIVRARGCSDDFAHSVNLGCVAIWHSTQRWPNLAINNNYTITGEQEDAFDPE
jgi:hypothetical protein